jgi:hypothetical protein
MKKYYEVEGTATVVFSEIVHASSEDDAIKETKKTLHVLGQEVIDLKVHNIESLIASDFKEEY